MYSSADTVGSPADTVGTDSYMWDPPLVSRVSRDRSLEEFLDGAASDGSDAEEVPRGNADDAEREAGEGRTGDADAGTDPERDGPDPIAPTYRWSPDGVACGACGEKVRARWRADDAFVCGDCKEW